MTTSPQALWWSRHLLAMNASRLQIHPKSRRRCHPIHRAVCRQDLEGDRRRLRHLQSTNWASSRHRPLTRYHHRLDLRLRVIRDQTSIRRGPQRVLRRQSATRLSSVSFWSRPRCVSRLDLCLASAAATPWCSALKSGRTTALCTGVTLAESTSRSIRRGRHSTDPSDWKSATRCWLSTATRWSTCLSIQPGKSQVFISCCTEWNRNATLNLWRQLLTYGYSYKASACARPT